MAVSRTPRTPASTAPTVSRYTVTDDDGAASNTATVTIVVNDINDAPVATDNDYFTDEDTAVRGSVVTDDTGDGVDSDSDGTLTPNATLVGDVTDGTLTLNADGSFTYTPDPGFNGTDSFHVHSHRRRRHNLETSQL